MSSHRMKVFGSVAFFTSLLIGGIVWVLVAQADRGAKGSVAGVRPSIPVTVCTVQQQDVPIYRYGIGSVRPFNTVKVGPRVAGELVQVLFKEGEEVRAGDILARIDARTYEAVLRQAEANLRRERARLDSADPELRRVLELKTKGISTEKSVEVQKAVVEQLKAELDADKALVDKATIDRDFTVIRAPIDGRIGLRSVDAGNYVLPDTSIIATINQVTPIAVIFSLPDIDLLPVTEQMAAGRTLVVAALSRDNRLELEEGKLATIDNQIDAKTGTFKLKATFDNTRGRLWPGQFVNARLHLNVQQAGTVIPAQAVQRGPNGTYVFTVASNDTVEMRPVVPTQIENGVALIRSGLHIGEKVVVDGQYRLEPGERVSLDLVAQFAGVRDAASNPCALSKQPAS
jgi:membrane fusion protein, multidrug efflux system